MKRIGIIAKRKSDKAVSAVCETLPWFREQGYETLIDPNTAVVLGIDPTPYEQIRDEADVIVVFGGDGTLLSAARLVEGHDTPILGINLGGLGFMAEVPLEDIHPALERALAGQCSIEHRVMLRAYVHRGGERIALSSVLNDVVINKSAVARLIHIDTAVDGEHLTTFNADGLIICTPTGSTAYSLSAGGPILYPTLNCVLLTPICPHALANRPVVLPDHVRITATIAGDENVYLTMDGQVGFDLVPGDTVEIVKSEHTTRLLIPCEREYFGILRSKLKWGER